MLHECFTSIMVSSFGAMLFSTSSFSLRNIMGFRIWVEEKVKGQRSEVRAIGPSDIIIVITVEYPSSFSHQQN